MVIFPSPIPDAGAPDSGLAAQSPIPYIRYSRMANGAAGMGRSVSNPQLVLRPQDLVVLLRLALQSGSPPGYAALGTELGLTASEVHAAVERAVVAQLAVKGADARPAVVRAALKLFLQHGARYCFPATRGGMTRGVPTGYAAAPLKDRIRPGDDPPPVWPSASGTARGLALQPLYPSVPEAAARNPELGELLALFDAVRGGSARERALAVELLDERLAA
jgi:hypothetical protein